MKCNNPKCKKEIPPERKKTAKHCSDTCSYEVKKLRSIKQYSVIKKPLNEIIRNENILAQLYQMQELGKIINGYDLGKLGFNFGLSTEELKMESKYLSKVVGNYAYYYDTSYNLRIWKLDIV